MTRLAAMAPRAATTRGALDEAEELAMTVAVCSDTTVFVSVTRVTTPRLLTAPVLDDTAGVFVVPVIRNMLDPSSWLAVMMDRVEVVEGAAELSGAPLVVSAVMSATGEEDDSTRAEEAEEG